MNQQELKTEVFVEEEQVFDASSGEHCVPCIFTVSPPSVSSPHTTARSLTRSLGRLGQQKRLPKPVVSI